MTRHKGWRAAQWYAKHGWPVFPVDNTGKHLNTHGFRHYAACVESVDAWWRELGDDAWPALTLTAASGFCALHVEGGEEAIKGLRPLTAPDGCGYLRRTPTVIGIDGSQAFVWTRNSTPLKEGHPTKGAALAPGVYLITEGWVPLPPMPGYEWDPWTRPNEQDVWHLSGRWLELCRDPMHKPETIASDAPKWAASALSDELLTLQGTSSGDHNRALNRAAFVLGQLVGSGLLEEVTVVAELEAAARSWGWSQREARSCIKCGLKAGKRKPRVPRERVA